MANKPSLRKQYEKELEKVIRYAEQMTKEGHSFPTFDRQIPKRVTQQKLSHIKSIIPKFKAQTDEIPTSQRVTKGEPISSGKKGYGTVDKNGTNLYRQSENADYYKYMVAMKNLESRGYVFDLTKEQIRAMSWKGYDIDNLYENAIWIDKETGEQKSGVERRFDERHDRGLKAFESRLRNAEMKEQGLLDPDKYDINDLESFEKYFSDVPDPDEPPDYYDVEQSIPTVGNIYYDAFYTQIVTARADVMDSNASADGADWFINTVLPTLNSLVVSPEYIGQAYLDIERSGRVKFSTPEARYIPIAGEYLKNIAEYLFEFGVINQAGYDTLMNLVEEAQAYQEFEQSSGVHIWEED